MKFTMSPALAGVFLLVATPAMGNPVMLAAIESCIPAYSQCGGSGFKSSISCCAGTHCAAEGEWWSSCAAGPAPAIPSIHRDGPEVRPTYAPKPKVNTCNAPPSTDPALLARILHSLRTLPGVPTVDLQNPSNNPVNVQRVMRILPEVKFNYLVSQRNAVYTYEGFLQSVAKWPAYCGESLHNIDLDGACAKEIASAFAQFVQETGANSPWIAKTTGTEIWRQGLYYVNEVGGGPYRSNCEDTKYWAKYYPCAPNVEYFGRGAKQLSYPYNYGPFSAVVFNDRFVLLNDPGKVSTSPFLAFASAVWFTMTPQSPKPSIHDINVGFYQPGPIEAKLGITAGFGAIISVTNGGIECDHGGAQESEQAANRIEAYKHFAKYLNAKYNPNDLGCKNMKPFPQNGVAAVNTY
eukprot:Ihof_evm8s132 gene=Ihof_evmTU8s132